ncbi:MAG: phenylacetate--CoA ligase family protein [Anaerolineae bacterium]
MASKADGHSTRQTFAEFRRGLPLPVRMGYGWLKRRLLRAAVWDDPEFQKLYGWLLETQWWPRELLERLQLERLQQLIAHAYDQTSYYRHIMDAHGLKPAGFRSLADLANMPLLTKEDVRANLQSMIARDARREDLIYATTGGSTGQALGLYQYLPTRHAHEEAYRLRQWQWMGYRFGDRVVNLRATALPGRRRGSTRAWWDYSTNENTLYLSSHTMTEQNLPRYVALIRDFGPRFVHALPSSLELLARYMRSTGQKGIRVQAISCESETIYPEQRELLESQFGGRVYGGYGLTERVADAVECSSHEGYHVSMEYGILELVDRDGALITEPGLVGRVVGTGFDTHSMPLIRYATDDLASYAEHPCSCGREMVLIASFAGRLQEFVVSRRGHLIPVSTLVPASRHAVWESVRELQFVQEAPGELRLEVAKAPDRSEREVSDHLLPYLYERLGRDAFALHLVFTDQVQRTGRGKRGLMRQQLPIDLTDLYRQKVDAPDVPSE